MRREVLTGLVLAGGLSIMPTFDANASPNPHIPAISLDGFPNKLPSAVRKEVNDAAAVVMTDESTGQGEGRGSAVRIEPNIYLSAGHVVNQNDGRLKPLTAVCGGIAIDAPTRNYQVNINLGQDQPGMLVTESGIKFNPTKIAGSFNNSNLNIPDYSLFYTPYSSPAKKASIKYQPIKIASSTVGDRINTKVYAVNYEPTSSNVERDPSEEDLTASQFAAGYSRPAIYGGVILGHYRKTDLLVVAEGMKSYGKVFDKFGRAGESGGGVEASNGQLIGISVRGPKNNDTTVKDIEHEFRVKLNGMGKNRPLSFSLIQPITRSMIRSMTKRLDDAPTCLGKGGD